MTTAGYSGSPLAKKLGIRANSRVLLLGAPADLVLAPFDTGVTTHRRAGAGPYELIIAFCPTRQRLVERFDNSAARLTTAGALWIGWPKKASGRQTDLDEAGVREYGLAHGLVDVKVAAIDATWSGLKFVRRLADR